MNPEVVRIGELWALARRWRWWLAVGAIGTGLLGVGVSALKPPTYSASSLVLVAGSPTTSAVKTEAQVAGSEAVLVSVADHMRLPGGASALAHRVSATEIDGNVIRISGTGTDPRKAQELTALVTENYVRYSTDLKAKSTDAATALLIPQRDNLRAQLDTVDRRMAELRAYPLLPATAASPELSVRLPVPQLHELANERAAILEDLGLIESRIAAQVGSVGDPARHLLVIDQADRPAGKSLPSRMLTVLAFAAVGAALTMLGLLVRRRRDPRVHTPARIAESCGAPILAIVPSRSPATPQEAEADRIAYQRARARLSWVASDGTPAATTLVAVDLDHAATGAAHRLADESEDAADLGVLVAVLSDPMLPDLHDHDRVVLVVTCGALANDQISAAGAACRAVGYPPFGVLLVYRDERWAEFVAASPPDSPLERTLAPR